MLKSRCAAGWTAVTLYDGSHQRAFVACSVDLEMRKVSALIY
jgi:hypothetical protein